MKIDLEKFNKYKEEGWLKNQTHPTLDLTIWNYTKAVQYEDYWDEVTLMCRGLVTNSGGEIIAYPMKKFFNYSQLKAWDKVPSGDFDVIEKVDGSLIQMFRYEGEIVVCSKGSFNSAQAQMAKEILRERSLLLAHIKDNLNYIFELIHPDNRIVVDYKDKIDLIFLTAIDCSGKEVGYNVGLPGFPSPTMYNDLRHKNLEYLRDFIEDGQEGFILRFKSGERMKIKSEEYLRLHRIVTNTSSKGIWKTLKEGGDIKEMMERTPDEFDEWVFKTIGKLFYNKRVIIFELMKEYAYGFDLRLYNLKGETAIPLVPRKDIARYFKTCKHTGLLFSLLDGRDIDQKLWDMVEPKFEKAFFNEH